MTNYGVTYYVVMLVCTRSADSRRKFIPSPLLASSCSWLMATSSISKGSSFLRSCFDSASLVTSSLTLDYTGPTQIIQGNQPISVRFITFAKSLLPWMILICRLNELGFGHLWWPLLCLHSPVFHEM